MKKIIKVLPELILGSISCIGVNIAYAYDDNLSGYKIMHVIEDQTTHVIYAGTDQGLFVSSGGVKNWSLKTTEDGLQGNKILDIATDGSDVYVIDQDEDNIRYADMSHDQGKSWEVLNTEYAGAYKNVKYDSGKLYLMAGFDNTSSPFIPTGFILESQDNGNSWKSLDFPIDTVKEDSFSASNGNLCFVDWWTNFLYVSQDDGQTWSYDGIYDSSGSPHLNSVVCDAKDNVAIVATDRGTNIRSFDFHSVGPMNMTGADTNIVKKSIEDSFGENWAVTDDGLYISTDDILSNLNYQDYESEEIALPSRVINDVYANNEIALVATDNGIASLMKVFKFKAKDTVNSINFTLSSTYQSSAYTNTSDTFY